MQPSRTTIGIVGLGFLGRGIAACLLGYGFKVKGFTRQQSTHDAARKHIGEAVGEMVDHKLVAAVARDAWPSKYEATSSLDTFRDCDFVIESVIEDLNVKNGIFDQLEATVRDDVPIASNTSALPITVLQKGRKHPRRFVGTHWGEPVHAMRFMEIIRGEQTSDEAFQMAMELGDAAGKDPAVLKKDIDGFIVNRIGYAMYREAFHILESGVADVESIDRAFRNAVGLWATLAGPFRWMDLTGANLYPRVMRNLLPKLSTSTEIPPTMLKIEESGAEGIANRKGYYQYTDEEAERWEKLLREHAWAVRELQEKYFGKPSGQPSSTDRK